MAMHSPLAISHISLSQSQSQSSASRSNGSRMFDVDSPSVASATKDFMYQRTLAPNNAVPLLVRLERRRILGVTTLGVGCVVTAMVFLQRGIVLKSYQLDERPHSDAIDEYNFYVGMATSLLLKPLLALVMAVVPAVLLCFLTGVSMRENHSRRTRFVLSLFGTLALWLLANGFQALYVHEQSSVSSPAVGESDLSDWSNATETPYDNNASSSNTILRSAMQTPIVTANSSRDQCSLPSPRRLPSQLDFGFPAREWLQDMLPFAPTTTDGNTLTVELSDGTVGNTTLPMTLAVACNLVRYALRATDDFYREQGVAANASVFELVDLPDDFANVSGQDPAMTLKLLEATNATMQRAFEDSGREHLKNFSVAETQLQFVRFPWASANGGELVFEGVTLEIPMHENLLRREVVLTNDTTQSVIYGDEATRGVFEINPKEECGRTGCVVSPVGAALTTAPADEGSQVRALPICLDAVSGAEDYEATLDVAGTECELRSNSSMLILSFAKRIQGDTMSSTDANNTAGALVTLTNARKVYQVTAGRLSWTTVDLASNFHASCEASDCSGLAFPLASDGEHVVVGTTHLPMQDLTMYTPSVHTWTPLVTSNAQEVDMSDILKNDFVFPRNFADVSNWEPVESGRCERERGDFMDRVERLHLFSEHALRPAYQSALFWLFQRGVVRRSVTLSTHEETLDFAASSNGVDVVLSVPATSALLSFVGCALLLTMSVLVFMGGKGREAEIERHFKPHHLARVMLNDAGFSRNLLRCDLLNVGNRYLNSSELLDEFEITGVALRHRSRPSDVLMVPRSHMPASASSSQQSMV